MDARHHHSAAAAAAADPMQVDQAVSEVTQPVVSSNDKIGLEAAINNEPGAIHGIMIDDIHPRLTKRDVVALTR